MSVSKRIRFEVFKRDLFTCQYCGRRPPDVILECDHVEPKCDGGSDEMDNLTTSCFDCNRGKAGNGLGRKAPLIDEMARLEALQEMAERSRLLKQERVVLREQDTAITGAVEQARQWWIGRKGDDYKFDPNSMKMFLQRGLSLSDIRDAFTISAVKSDRDRMSWHQEWSYFCGVCWGKIRDKKDAAAV